MISGESLNNLEAQRSREVVIYLSLKDVLYSRSPCLCGRTDSCLRALLSTHNDPLLGERKKKHSNPGLLLFKSKVCYVIPPPQASRTCCGHPHAQHTGLSPLQQSTANTLRRLQRRAMPSAVSGAEPSIILSSTCNTHPQGSSLVSLATLREFQSQV